MALLKKLAFWKKEDPFDLPSDMPAEGLETPQGQTKAPDPFAEPAWNQQAQSLAPSYLPPQKNGSELELINSKLDTIKAMLTSIEQRLAAQEKSEKKLW